MTMPGCIIIILVRILVLSVFVYRAMFNCIFGCQAYIVDNLKLTEIEDKKCPRINQYTMETLMRTIGNAKCHHGKISFDNFKVLIISLSWKYTLTKSPMCSENNMASMLIFHFMWFTCQALLPFGILNCKLTHLSLGC